MSPTASFDPTPISRLAGRRRFASRVGGILWIAVAALLTLGAVAALDFWLPLSEPLRRGLWWTVAVAVVLGAWRLWVRLGRNASKEALVRQMEAASPSVGQRLRTAWQLLAVEKTVPRSQEQRHFLDRLAQESQQAVRAEKWSLKLPRIGVWRPFWLSAAVFGTLVAAASHWPDFRLAVRRVVAPTHAPTFTKIAWLSAPGRFDETHPPRLAVSLSGRTASPVLRLRDAGASAWREVPLTALSDGRSFDAVLSGLTADTEAMVAAGDGVTDVRKMLFRPIPKLESAKVTVSYPDYTGLKPATFNGGDVKAVEGSQVEWLFTFNTRPDGLEWKMASAERPDVSSTVRRDGREVRVVSQLPVAKIGATLAVKDENGQSIDAWKYEVQGVRDELPKVEILEPGKDREATAVAELPVRVRARDDFGVAELGLILEAAGEKQWTMEKVIDARDVRDVTELTRAMLETVPLTIRDNVRLYAYALDHKPRGGPRAISPLRAIDIRDFKLRSRWMGKFDGPTPSMEDLADLNKELVRPQREIVSDAHLLKEEVRTGVTEEARGKSGALADREAKVAAKAEDMALKWQALPRIPRDDVQLMFAAASQLSEATSHLKLAAVEKGFTGADRALTSLLQIRKHMMKLLFESNQKSDCDCESEQEKQDLAALAREAERLANEEKSVGAQLAPAAPDQPRADVAASKRQQEVVVADAGELYAAIVRHPKKNDGMIRLMDEAEQAVRKADETVHGDAPPQAIAPLGEAESHLRDVADFIRAMDSDKLASTLKELASKAKNDAKKQKDAAGKPEPEKGAAKDNDPKAETASADKKDKKDGKEGKEAGEKPASATAGNKPSSGSKPGSQGTQGTGQGGNRATAEAARNTELADAILKSLAESAGQRPGGAEDKAGKEGAKPDDKGKPGSDGADLAKLRENAGTEGLAADLKKAAEAAREGREPGAADKPGEDKAALAARLEKMAKELAGEAAKLEASKLARLAELSRQGKELRAAAKKDAAEKEAAGGNSGMTSAERQMLEQLRDDSGLKPGTNVVLNGRVLTIPSKDEPRPVQPSGRPNGADGPGAGGPAITRFVDDLQRLGDEAINRNTPLLSNVTPQIQAQGFDAVIARLEAMMVALPGSTEARTAQGAIPEGRRREIEDYYKNLSDDFGDDTK